MADKKLPDDYTEKLKKKIKKWGADLAGIADLEPSCSSLAGSGQEELGWGAISHKAVARMADIGRQGKNLLLITAKYGSRVRLVTVLTNVPLKVDGHVKNRCGECAMCRDACPVCAVKGVGAETYYRDR